MVAGLGSALEVAERSAGVVRNELGVDASGRAHGAHVDRFGDMRRDGPGGRGGDADDDGESDVDELLQLGIVDLGRAHSGIGGRRAGARLLLLLRTIDQ